MGKKSIPQEQELKLSDAFYEKDDSNLELVVKVKNCSDYKNLPIRSDCDILKEYCRFMEIVEQSYGKLHSRRSIRQAIEIAREEGILTEYLDRKSREVINMLCAKYDYKMEIAVKQEEAREEGKLEKAIEDAIEFYENGVSVEIIAKSLKMTTERVLEIVKAKETQNA